MREVHTVALALEDLTQVATATSALVDAGLLNAGEVPWLVSIHELQIIAQLGRVSYTLWCLREFRGVSYRFSD